MMKLVIRRVLLRLDECLLVLVLMVYLLLKLLRLWVVASTSTIALTALITEGCLGYSLGCVLDAHDVRIGREIL